MADAEGAAEVLISVEVRKTGGKKSKKFVRISVLRRNLKMLRGVIFVQVVR